MDKVQMLASAQAEVAAIPEMTGAANVLSLASNNAEVHAKVQSLMVAGVDWTYVLTVLFSCYDDIKAGNWAAVLTKLSNLLPQS